MPDNSQAFGRTVAVVEIGPLDLEVEPGVFRRYRPHRIAFQKLEPGLHPWSISETADHELQSKPCCTPLSLGKEIEGGFAEFRRQPEMGDEITLFFVPRPRRVRGRTVCERKRGERWGIQHLVDLSGERQIGHDRDCTDKAESDKS